MGEAAALGFRVHSGWAAAVAVAGSPQRPKLLVRSRIELADGGLAGSKQPYHAAVRLDLEQAEAWIERCRESSLVLARRAVSAMTAEVQHGGFTLSGAGILFAAGRPLPALPVILRSHPLLHTAEGEFFREAVLRATERCGLPVKRVREREVWEQGAERFGLPVAELQRRIGEFGKAFGAPWTQDEKMASLAGWMVLEPGG